MNSLIATFGRTRAEYQLVPKIKLVYIKHDLDRPFGKTYYPDTVELQNNGTGATKGDTIPIGDNWWSYIRKINPNTQSYNYTRSVGEMWINRPYAEGEIPRAERIHCGGNFAAWDIETSTHVRLVPFPNNLNTDVLDSAVFNWFNMPYMFWKACAVNQYGQIIKVANALDVYFPLIGDVNSKELWIQKSKVEILPENAYTFIEGDVYLRGELFKRTGVVK